MHLLNVTPETLPLFILAVGILLLVIDTVLTSPPAETAADEDMEKD